MIQKLTIAAAVAIALTQSAGAASLDDMFSVRGFGTLGVVHTDTDELDFARSTTLQTKGAGYTDKWSKDVDSRAGVQLDMKFTDRFSAVVQLVSEAMKNNTWDGDPNKDYKPSLEWANLSYKLTDNLTVRVGRIVNPLLMTAEYDKVGYANHWMRSPLSYPYTSNDGGEVTYKSTIGGATNTLRVMYGGNTVRSPSFEGQAKNKTIVDTLEFGSWTVRAAYLHFDTGFVNATRDYFAYMSQMIPSYVGLTKTSGASWDFGATYDANSWFVSGELHTLSFDADFAEVKRKWYVTGGARLGKFTPYAIYGETVQGKLDMEFYPGVPQEVQDGVVDNNCLGSLSCGQKQYSVGMRWDVYTNIALKAQYDHFDTAANSPGNFVNVQPTFKRGSNVNVFGLSVDFLF